MEIYSTDRLSATDYAEWLKYAHAITRELGYADDDEYYSIAGNGLARALKTYNGTSPLGAWVHRIVKQAIINHWRKENRSRYNEKAKGREVHKSELWWNRVYQKESHEPIIEFELDEDKEVLQML